MGMFDYVNYECVCPVCHSKVTGFQSKSGESDLKTVEPTNVSNFYAACKQCGCWIDYKAKHTTEFTRTVTGKDDKILDKHTMDIRFRGLGVDLQKP